jgi:hypothetical protein
MMIGAYTCGILSDWKGRKFGFFATAAFTFIFGLGSAFAPSYGVLVFCRFLVGVGLYAHLLRHEPHDALAQLFDLNRHALWQRRSSGRVLDAYGVHPDEAPWTVVDHNELFLDDRLHERGRSSLDNHASPRMEARACTCHHTHRS